MGVFFSSIFSSLFGRKEVRVLILGLDNAGKTTILCAFPLAKCDAALLHLAAGSSCQCLPHGLSTRGPARPARLTPTPQPPLTALLSADRLQVDEPVTTVPTIGFNVETLSYKNIKFQVWDLGGQTSIRPYWRCYYPNTDAIIFVVDSTDVERLELAKTELFQLLEVRYACALAGARCRGLPPHPCNRLRLHPTPTHTLRPARAGGRAQGGHPADHGEQAGHEGGPQGQPAF